MRTAVKSVQTGQLAPAFVALNDIAAANASDADVISKVLAHSAQASFRGGAYEDASAALDAAALQAPSDGETWFQAELTRVRQRLSQADVPGASQAAEAALVLAAQRIAAYDLYLAQSEGTVSNEPVPRRPISLSTALSRLASAFFSEGEIEGAKDLWTRAVTANPGTVKAKLGLAKIALAEADPTTAWTLARNALTAGQFTAKTIVAWEILARAAKQGGGIYDATLVPLLDQAQPSVRARSLLTIARAARRFEHLPILAAVTAWAIANKVQYPIECLEILKASRGKAKAGDTGYSVRNLTNTIHSVAGKLPREAMAEACLKMKLQFSAEAPDIPGAINSAIAGLTEPALSKTRHALARVLISAAFYNEARTLLTSNAASQDTSIRDRALIALGKLEDKAQNYASAAQYYQQAVAGGAMPARFRGQTISRWVKSAAKAGSSLSLDSVLTPILAMLATSEEHFEIARVLGASSNRPTALGTSVLTQGLALAATQIRNNADPTIGRYLAFLATRAGRECKEFALTAQFYTDYVLPRQTLWWSNSKEYWDLLNESVWVLCLAGDATAANSIATAVIGDTATPPIAKAQMYSTVGRIALFISRDRELATSSFAGAITERQQCAETASCHFWLGVIEFRVQNRESANVHFSRVVALAQRHLNLGWLQGLKDRALVFLLADSSNVIPEHPLRNSAISDLQIANC